MFLGGGTGVVWDRSCPLCCSSGGRLDSLESEGKSEECRCLEFKVSVVALIDDAMLFDCFNAGRGLSGGGASAGGSCGSIIAT